MADDLSSEVVTGGARIAYVPVRAETATAPRFLRYHGVPIYVAQEMTAAFGNLDD